MTQNFEKEESELKFENSVMPLSYNRTTTPPVNQIPEHDASINQVVINIDRDEAKNTMSLPSQKLDTNKEKMGIFKSWLSSSYIKKHFAKLSVLLSLHIYLLYATYYNYAHGIQWKFCEGLGFLLILVAFGYLYIISVVIIKQFGHHLVKAEIIFNSFYSSRPWIGKVAYVIIIVAIVIFLAVDTTNDRRRLVSAGGVLGLVLIAFIFSKHRKEINWRQVTWGLVLQFIFGLGILRWTPGRLFFECIGQKVDRFLSFTDVGSAFIYGHLITQKPFLPKRLPNDSIAFNVTTMINEYQAAPVVVVFKALSVIYFFSFVINMLFYLGYVQNITLKIGYLLRKTIGTSTVESVSAAANIFLGQAMTPLLVAPYIKDLTLSELHAVITGGFATIAGTTMAAYISFGISAAHLLSASVMSAPAALACAKILYPEVEVSKTNKNIDLEQKDNKSESNVIDAATRGASSAATIVLQITAIVIACIAFVAFLNSVVTYLGVLVGFNEDFTFDYILGKIFIPLAYIMGIEWKECEEVSLLIGIKTAVNEFIAYRNLGLIMDKLSPRSVSIATYALCGYANPGSIGIQLATFGAICPERMADYSTVILRAFFAGSLACFMTACIAGALIDSNLDS